MLKKQLSIIKNDDKSHDKQLIALETRVTATEKTLAGTNISLSSTKTSSLNDKLLRYNYRLRVLGILLSVVRLNP